jgi:hypothetical protein
MTRLRHPRAGIPSVECYSGDRSLDPCPPTHSLRNYRLAFRINALFTTSISLLWGATVDQSPSITFAATMARMFVDCLRVIHADAYPSKHIGASLEEMYVSFAVHIGTVEGRPMSATKIAGYLSMPRTNVLRALIELKKKDIVYSVGNVYLTNCDRLSRRITPALMNKQIDTVVRASKQLIALQSSV